MSGTSTPTSDNHQALLAVGHQCSKPSCLLVDFLPFKCQHCQERFCGEHFLSAEHDCPSYVESQHNRVAPPCPLCNTPVAIPAGQDPNIRMEKHISSECSVMTGKSGKTKSAPVCSRGKCGKVLFAPIRCTKCKQQFCPQHRFPVDHACISATTASGSRSTTLTNLSVKTSAAGAHTVDVVKRTVASVSSPARPAVVPKSSTPASKPSTSFSNPFSQADRTSHSRTTPTVNDVSSTIHPTNTIQSNTQSPIDPIRAKAERESRRRAMQERAKKGLLSEEEKVRFAAEEAGRSKEGDGCRLM